MTTAQEMTPLEWGKGHDAAIVGHRKPVGGSRKRAGGPDPARAEEPVGKVEIFNALRLAAPSMGLNRTHLSLMWALINFPREQILRPGPDGRLIVFPSNATLCSRLDVLADSTISRALQTLETAGLVLRHMSPNRKRYRVRDAGEGGLAFGIDIMPFWASRHDILAAAKRAAERSADHRIAKARLRAAIARASTEGDDRAATAATIKDAHSMLRRRRVDTADLLEAAARLDSLCGTASSSKSHDTDMQSARHKEDSETEDRSTPNPGPEALERAFPKVTRLIRQVAASQPQENLQRVTQLVALGLGVPVATWQSATERVGTVSALACLGRIAENTDTIDRPTAYFAALVRTVASGEASLLTLMGRRSGATRSTPPSCVAIGSHATVRRPAQPRETP